MTTLRGAAAWAADVPIGGKSVGLGARNAARRTFAFRSTTDPAIAAPFPDPAGGASLRVFVSSGPGQCHAEMALPGTFWAAIGGNGAAKGWRYRDQSASAQGVRAVTIQPRNAGGRIVVKARGAFPCALEWTPTAPLHIELRLGGTRYCNAFGGSVFANANEPGKYHAIAFIWMSPTTGSLCGAAVKPTGDGDGDAVATRLFADVPVAWSGAAPASDHVGTQADANCH
jgi:hypothetical protein